MEESTFTDREKEIHDYAFRKGSSSMAGCMETLHKLADLQMDISLDQYKDIVRLDRVKARAEKFAEAVESAVQGFIDGRKHAGTVAMDCKELAVEFLTFLIMEESACQTEKQNPATLPLTG